MDVDTLNLRIDGKITHGPAWDGTAESLDTYSPDVELLLLGTRAQYGALVGPRLVAALQAKSPQSSLRATPLRTRANTVTVDGGGGRSLPPRAFDGIVTLARKTSCRSRSAGCYSGGAPSSRPQRERPFGGWRLEKRTSVPPHAGNANGRRPRDRAAKQDRTHKSNPRTSSLKHNVRGLAG